ncbi:MAG: DNA repair protein RecO [Flavobacteriaceae bacterium]|jgi:DNA repair protein RecO (recombination protein O)
MLIETDAIVLSAIKFGDTSLIARCYCKKIGLKSFLLKGILSTKKGSLKKSLFQPLSMISLITQVKNQSSEGLHYIKEARVNFSLIEIPTDIKKNAVTLFLSEILTRVITEEGTPNIHLYHFIEKNIKRLESEAFSPLFHLKFMMELSRHLGFYPNRSNISEGYFDLESGCFCSSSPSKHFIEGDLLMAFKKLLGTDFDTLDRCVIDNSLRIKVLNVLIDYFNLHLPNFGKIKSIDILHEIFR